MRGDDALGPMLIERLEQLPVIPNIDHQWDFQLCPEHALAFVHYDCILLVDASTEIEKSFCLSRVLPSQVPASTSHALSPSSLYQIFMTHVLEKGSSPPLVLQMEIKAYQFELGSSISLQAQENLDKAWLHLRSTLLQHRYFMALYGFVRCV